MMRIPGSNRAEESSAIVLHVGNYVVAAPVEILRLGQLPAAVGERAKLLQRQGIQSQGLGLVEAPAVPDLLPQLVQ